MMPRGPGGMPACLPNGMPVGLPPGHPHAGMAPRPMVAPPNGVPVSAGGFNLHELMSQLTNLTPQQLQEIASMSQLVLHTQQGAPPRPGAPPPAPPPSAKSEPP